MLEFTKSQIKTIYKITQGKHQDISFKKGDIKSIQNLKNSLIEITLNNGDYFQITKRGKLEFNTITRIYL